MKQQGLAFFTDTHLTLIGMLLFLAVFVGAWLWVYRQGSRDLYRAMSTLPLQDGTSIQGESHE